MLPCQKTLCENGEALFSVVLGLETFGFGGSMAKVNQYMIANGGYNPDWAYVEEVDGKQRVYFVMETKGGGNGTPALRPSERAKIECAQRHFEALGLDDVTYDVETTYHYAQL